jgi:O-methyltransferase involved in polyketide biosynthesis
MTATRTLQGVTVYLTPGGVDSTLAFIANHSGPGSAVIYTETLSDTHRNDVKNMRRTARVTGEGYIFSGSIKAGLSSSLPSAASEIFTTRCPRIKRLYFTGPNAGRVITKGVDIVSARVNKTGE